MKIDNVNFLTFVTVAGRAVTGTGPEQHEAEVLDFPWIAVWPKGKPEQKRITTIFNVRDRAPTEEELTAPSPKPKTDGPSKPTPQGNSKA